jgi:hypothetical protein
VTDRDGVRHEGTAPHLSRGFAGLRGDARRALARDGGPHLLSHHTSGVYDFDVDVLDRAALDGADPEQVRQECLRAARKVVLMLDGTHRSLQEPRTGALIRTVLHGDRGALICASVVPRQQLTAFRLDRLAPGPLTAMRGVENADVRVGQLVDDVRERLRQASQNPGGWSTRKPDADPDPAAADPDRAEPVVSGTVDGDLAAACVRALDPADLHFVAHVRNAEPVFTADVLDDDRLAHFFTEVTAADRREFYGDFAAGFGVLAGRFNRAAGSVLGELLHRIVLDVQQGALFYYRLGVGEYLFGVTLDQSRVSESDAVVARLADPGPADPGN